MSQRSKKRSQAFASGRKPSKKIDRALLWIAPPLALIASIVTNLNGIGEGTLGRVLKMEDRRREASAHLVTAAEHIGLRDGDCLYSELLYQSAEDNPRVRLPKARSEIEAARKALRWVLWNKGKIKLRADQLEAESWLLDRKYDEASLSIEDGLAINERSLSLITYKAAVLSARGHARQAEKELSKAYEEAKKRVDDRDANADLSCAAVSLGRLRADLKQDAELIEPLFQEALLDSPNNFVTQWAYGNFLYLQGRFGESLPHLARAYSKDHDEPVNRLQLADAHFQMAELGKSALAHYQEALPHYEEGFKNAEKLMDPLENEKDMRIHFGKALFQLGKTEGAKEELEKGLLDRECEYSCDAWLGESFLLSSRVYACLQRWDLFEASAKQAIECGQGMEWHLLKFRNRKRSDSSKWAQWGCDGSLTLRRESTPLR